MCCGQYAIDQKSASEYAERFDMLELEIRTLLAANKLIREFANFQLEKVGYYAQRECVLYIYGYGGTERASNIHDKDIMILSKY